MVSDKELLEKAKQVSNNAYCPYSKFAVGACVLYKNGNIYTGCNIENASYGLSLCAERNAISTAIAQGETSDILKIAIYSPNTVRCFPCGACRQWIQEFSNCNNVEIILEDENHQCCSFFINDLLPYSFKLL